MSEGKVLAFSMMHKFFSIHLFWPLCVIPFIERAHELVGPEHPEQGPAFKCVSISTHKLLSSRVESHQGPALKATNSFIFSLAHKRRVFCKLPARSDQQKVLS